MRRYTIPAPQTNISPTSCLRICAIVSQDFISTNNLIRLFGQYRIQLPTFKKKIENLVKYQSSEGNLVFLWLNLSNLSEIDTPYKLILKGVVTKTIFDLLPEAPAALRIFNFYRIVRSTTPQTHLLPFFSILRSFNSTD